MKKLFLLLTFVSLFTACKDDNGSELPDLPKSDMTVIAYLVADTSVIPDDLWTNIAAMYDGLSLMNKPASVFVY